MIVRRFFDFLKGKTLNEAIIPISVYKNYLDSFFNENYKEFKNIKNSGGLLWILSKINIDLNQVYSFDIQDDGQELYVETILKNKYSLIIIYVSNEDLLYRIENDLYELVNELKIFILHEFIHIEQFKRGHYLHPIYSKAKQFRILRDKFEKLLISEEEFLDGYLNEPYEIMTYAATSVLLLLREYNIKEILNKFKNGEIEDLEKIKDKKKRNKIEKYIYEYCLELS